ncbi:alpha/beta fold hydrolase [Nocardioides sp. J2M5]|uniref:alpha/beta fold hydrolase n=1 Tax=Nocardioides palaemonis TaxID=2829810 RepID=UPI001BAD12FE|nr:alpha/beta fold hydrolase [Nocardioides palaemonis]MBS2938624.1 alpha/beta fold hydrolase [Nocardioides palaemonis]
MLVSERIGQLFVESDGGRDRLEYTEYGSGDQWVVLLHGLLMPRRMQQPLARAMAAQGLHVVTLDLLGHGRSDQPADPLVYSMTSFGEQVVALLDHLGAEQAVVGGTSLGANVALEVAVIAPDRVRGLVVEMPVLNNALVAGIVAFVPIMFAARYAPFTANALQRAARSVPRGLVPFWAGIALDTVDHRAETTAAMLHGVIFGRVAPSSRQRRSIQAPTLVVGHPVDPIHPFVDADMLAAELPHVRIERATSILEWRFRPERLTRAATDFALDCWSAGAARAGRSRKR